MELNSQYHFFFKKQIYSLPFNFKHCIDISPNILNCLIMSTDHQYQVESDVSDDVFQSFIDYLIYDRLPNILIDNINDYIQLSQEFHILEDFINEKKNYFGEYFVNLNGLQAKNTSNSTIYESEIAPKLDEYLEECGTTLLKSPIQSLYNIFNHKNRKLKQHNLAYNLIQQHFEETNDSSIFILLKSLDGSKLTQSNLDESISLREIRNNHMPNIDFSFLKTAIEKQDTFEERVQELESKTEKFMNQIMQKFDEEIQNLKQKHSEEIEELRSQIDRNEENMKLMQHKYTQDIELANSKIKELSDQIEQNQIEVEQDLELIKENHSNTSELLTNKIDQNSNNINKIQERIKQTFITNPSEEGEGILSCLKLNEKSPFDRLFVASQPYRDIYNIINPDSEDYYSTSNSGSFFIDFELEFPVNIIGIKIFSYTSYFPRSFDILIEGQTVKSIKNANELNGENKEMTINFDLTRGQKIRFLQTGKNWDDNSHFLLLKRFEILSNEEKYSGGVFQTLISNTEDKDPHKLPVIVSAKYFDFSSFYMKDSTKCVSSELRENLWFQIELTKGLAIITGFRLKKYKKYLLKSYKIIATDDVKNPIESWTTLIEINESVKNENQEIFVYKFVQPSLPSKYIRIVQTGPNWNNSLWLKFCHFDVFGTYFTITE